MNAIAASALYSGPDLENAARLSTLRENLLCNGVANAARQLAKVVLRSEHPGANQRPSAALLRGRHGDGMRILYVGRGRNRDWLLSAWCDSNAADVSLHLDDRTTIRAELTRLASDAHVILADDPPDYAHLSRPGRSVRLPAWIKQRVAICPDWSQQISDMRRSTRREISRLLRKHGFRCEISREESDFVHFYDQLYRPYIAARHGATAEFVSRDDFIAECRRGAVLRLLEGGEVVAASLARPIASSMAIVWTGARLDDNGKPRHGASAVLDYYCLLYSQLGGARWLDLGPSRPDLFDGTLNYKAGWNAQIHRGFSRTAGIELAFGDTHPGLAGLLSERAVVLRVGQRFEARVVLGAEQDHTDELRTLLERISHPGIDHYRIIVCDPSARSTAPDRERLTPDAELIRTSSIEQLVSAYTAHRADA